MKVFDVMTPNPVTVEVDALLEDAMELMDRHHVRHLPVLQRGTLGGVVSDRDLLEATGWLPRRVRGPFHRRTGAPCSRVRDLTRRAVVTIGPNDSLVHASADILTRGIGCLPVVRQGSLIGIVTDGDLLRAYLETSRDETDSPTVGQRMSTSTTHVEWYTSIGQAFELCSSAGVRHLPVLEGEHVVGILSDRDLRRAVGCGRHDGTPIEECMSRSVVTVQPESTLARAAALMVRHKISALPVTEEGGRYLGILTSSDLLDHCLTALREPSVEKA